MESKSGEKLLLILEYIINKKEPQRLLDISRNLQINSSTALRYLTTLSKSGYVEQDPKTLQYYSTFKICALAGGINIDEQLRSVSAPILGSAASLFGETAGLFTRKGRQAVCIDSVRPGNRVISANLTTGQAFPLHALAAGKLLLMSLTSEQIEEYFRTSAADISDPAIPGFTEKTAEKLQDARNRKFCISASEYEAGLTDLAVPIYNSTGTTIASLSIIGPSGRFSGELTDKIPALETYARSISEKLGAL